MSLPKIPTADERQLVLLDAHVPGDGLNGSRVVVQELFARPMCIRLATVKLNAIPEMLS